MKKQQITSLLVGLLISVLVVVGYHFLVKTKVGYVRTGYVLTQYKGMQEANAVFEKENQQVQTNLDTLSRRYDYLLGLQKNVSKLKQKEITYRLQVAEDDYNRYAKSASEQLEARRASLTAEVIKELNFIIEEFGKRNNYQLILGSTDAGSILYGDAKDDVSEDILTILNTNFAKRKK